MRVGDDVTVCIVARERLALRKRYAVCDDDTFAFGRAVDVCVCDAVD